jgi:hypothetical protein
MQNDFVVWLGPTAMATIVVAFIQVFMKLRDNRAARRLGLDQGFLARYSEDVKWINIYRHQAEVHMEWDQDMRMGQVTLQVAVNRLEEQLGVETTRFDPIRKAPPLFPSLDSEDDVNAHT